MLVSLGEKDKRKVGRSREREREVEGVRELKRAS
jgi:hypothetical protein